MLRTLSLLAPLSLVFLTGAFALPPEDISQFPLFTSGKENYHTFRIPSLLVTPKGNLLAICEGRKNNSADHGDIDLVMKRSTDGGLTWSKLSVLIAGGGKTMGNPCPVADKKTGAILLPFCLDNKIVFVMKSSDDGLTWSKPADITRQVMKAGWSWYATGPGVGIQTRSGRLVIPCDSKSGGGKSARVASDLFRQRRRELADRRVGRSTVQRMPGGRTFQRLPPSQHPQLSRE